MVLRAIRGRVRDECALRRELERWASGGADGPGRLGLLAGTSQDGVFVGLFDLGGDLAGDDDPAAASGARGRQTRWDRVVGLLHGPAVIDHPHVQIVGETIAGEGGGTGRAEALALGRARFARITWGRTADRDALWALRRRLARWLPEGRPDLLGLLSAATASGWLVEAAYHESEELTLAADRGEQEPEVAEILHEASGLVTVAAADVLRDLWLA
ncbi:hypothetical protein UG55_106737 [Frankia sp. EI5c]|uniref:hypothetical protein n=1 Tax=Frankia sp. EI5c TaxID=683316 RepID=UPI0007C256EF|nr:hypothetical protein [Frankia sp. EI5c]OAA20921.1 hypothetical protein UG55_106737 [Frankia sp. EI5c]